MKKALAAVLAVALAGVVATANAQVPNVQVYFDPNYSHTQTDCKALGTPDQWYVVMNNWNMWVLAVDFSISYPPAVYFQSDVPPAGVLFLGNSPTGIALTWSLPQNGFNPMLALTLNVLWLQCDCAMGPQPVRVNGYTPFAKANPTAIRWPDGAELPGVGMTSLICAGLIATDSKTWGGVKALYR